MKRIQKVQAELINGKINCLILLNESLENAQFAYYIFRNNERIHTSRYSPSPSFNFYTKKLQATTKSLGF